LKTFTRKDRIGRCDSTCEILLDHIYAVQEGGVQWALSEERFDPCGDQETVLSQKFIGNL
jgi:hypothetical protein